MRFINLLDGLTVQLARGVRWLAVLMVITTVFIVLLRYVLKVGAIPLQESVMYMHGLLFLIGIPYGLRQDSHVRVDILYAHRLRPYQRQINLFGHVIFLLPLSVFIVYTSWPYAAASWCRQ